MPIKKAKNKQKLQFQYDSHVSGKSSRQQYSKLGFGIIAYGGNSVLTPGDGYAYHIFTSSRPFQVQTGGLFDIFIVAGGAGGACSYPYTFVDTSGGGGGAGGLKEIQRSELPPGTYTISVGAGGASGNTNGTPSYISGPPIFTTITVTGGGTGGRWIGSTAGAQPGGSGGGAWNSGAGGSGISGQGNPGGSGGPYRAGGGGGAGGAGQPGPGTRSGGAASQLLYDIPSSYGTPGPNNSTNWFAGGGGGGAASGISAGASGGGGAGAGAPYPSSYGGNGSVNTGSGGGGGPAAATINRGGSGGSGIVIIRYLKQ